MENLLEKSTILYQEDLVNFILSSQTLANTSFEEFFLEVETIYFGIVHEIDKKLKSLKFNQRSKRKLLEKHRKTLLSKEYKKSIDEMISCRKTMDLLLEEEES